MHEGAIRALRAQLRERQKELIGWGPGDTIKLYRHESARRIDMHSTRVHPSKPRQRQEFEIVQVSAFVLDKKAISYVQGKRKLRNGEWGRSTSFYNWDWDFSRTEKIDA
jgi:hypothetical protein